MSKAEDFYNNISKYYNDIFPVEQSTLNFLKKHFIKGKVLDVACGCGEYSIALLKEGYDAYGNDISEDMVFKAQEFNKDRFIIVDMRNLHYDFCFENIYCIGTSLAHLKNEEDILNTLKGFSNLQQKQGILILQTVNFDRVLKYNVTALPKITSSNVEFERNYAINKKQINFSTRLLVNGKTYENNVDLFALKSELLNQLLVKAGYANIKLYNGFSNEGFDRDNSFALVCIATKK